MKRSFIIIILTLVLLLASCTHSSPPSYTNTPVTDAYLFQGATALALTASYPYFEDEAYAPLNGVIAQEVEAWQALYAEIYEQVSEECDKDPVFASLKRYVEATYTVASTKTEVSVTFDVRYYYGGNHEPAYTKTFTYYLDSGMVHETFTQTRRVYT